MSINACLAVSLLLGCASIKAASFDFESTATGYYPGSLTVTESGLTLTITPEGFPNGFVAISPGAPVTPPPPLLGSRAVIGTQVNPVSQDSQFAPLRFTFSSPVTSATFRFGDIGGDTDSPVKILAYDAGGTLLSTITDTYGFGVATGKSDIWSGPGAASYFILTSQPDVNPNSIYWEVLDVAAVPENFPTGLGLFVASAGLLALRRFRR
jgi:hypothetical protein